ncbi:hypothetical protein [Archangium sp.]|jgi:cell division septum initiation protein DivIVA|uniref:hypothetical protein n=1 Tax=Archangium sp. TaxID=1872627 RepID=UPI002ED9BA39
MKKLMAVLVFTLGTAAFAQDDANKNTQAMEEQKRNEGRNLGTGVDATEVDQGIKDATDKAKDVVGKAEDKVGLDNAKDGTFKKDKAFSMNGTLKGAAFDGITLARQGLPDADLDVRKETQVMLDGKKVELKSIPEGAQVRARFQLEGEEIVAVELNATSPKATKKSTK